MSGSATWDDLADAYDRFGGGRPARTLPMEKVFDWAVKSGLFLLQEDGTLIEKKDTWFSRGRAND